MLNTADLASDASDATRVNSGLNSYTVFLKGSKN
ncbi:hypothetical protein HNQ65_000072 [Prosthecobacter vanneervenii]|uniref:Uncharacterized protein n=1 Tax=Prosthecobacter vanneervenii TaxID=48466 RepID=A0A7W7Y6I2_9BACT|nr:hypothetical protein [Prosthecobacter vanneervenii]